jgi:Integrase zinc binding domain
MGCTVSTRPCVFHAPLASTTNEDFVWPTAREIRTVQDAASVDDKKPREAQATLSADGLYRLRDGRIWIPSSADDLQLRICMVGHTGLAGHRGRQATTETIASTFYWITIVQDVKTFCNTCLHCVSTTGGERMPDLSARLSIRKNLTRFCTLTTSTSARLVRWTDTFSYLRMTFHDMSGYCPARMWIQKLPLTR